MELGALLCLPKNPRCESCPLQDMCEAKMKGLTDVLPVKAAPKAKKVEARTVLLLTDGNRVYLRKRPAKGLLAGLWELPGLDGHLTEAEVTAAAESLGFAVKEIRKLKPHVHVFTHIEWHMEGYRVEVKGPGAQELVPAGRKEVEEVYSVPKAFAPFMNVFFEA